MTEKKHTVNVVIVLVQHPVLGYLLIPYTAGEGEDNTVYLTEQAFHASPKTVSGMNEAQQKAIRIASCYTEKNLMKVYSKEKTTSSFLKKLTPEYVKGSIRPFIEKKLGEMVELIRAENLPVYQNQTGNKTLYKHNRYRVSPLPTEVSFHFEVKNDQFQYSLQCFEGEKVISLQGKKPVITLVSFPAVLLLGAELHQFHDIEASRILPFTNKTTVSVDASLAGKYLENVVLPIARYHTFTYKGLPIYQEERTCEALLSIEKGIHRENMLRLVFRYGDRVFYPGIAPEKLYAYLQKNEEEVLLRFFYRNLTAEKDAVRKLNDMQLQLVDDSHFKLKKQTNDKDLTNWIIKNKEVLTKDFRLINTEKNADYCLDEVRIEQNITESQDWFELHITVVIGNFRIPFLRFRKNIIEGNREYLLPNGTLALLPEEWFSQYTDLFEFSEKREDSIRINQQYIGILQAALGNSKQEKIHYQGKTETAPPKELKAILRHYQEEGFNWMLHLNKHGLSGCLADDMGLGKTLQTLTLLQFIYAGNAQEQGEKKSTKSDETGQLFLFEEEKAARLPASLIVVPTSLLHNWRKEIHRFTSLSVYEYTGNHAENSDIDRLFGRFQLIMTSYGIMRNNIEKLSKYRFEYVVLDESQNIKNSDSQTFKCAIQLQSNLRLILTGTPIENSLKDLWSQFHFLQPGLLKSESEFNKQYIVPVKQGNARVESKLQKLIAPFILRRNKREVAPELPPLTEEIIYCEMTEQQDEVYKREKNSLRNAILQLGGKEQIHKNLTVLNGITFLRQLASHPRMVLPDYTGTSGKLEELISVFETLQSEGHKVLIFSSFVRHLELIAQAFNEKGWEYALLTGSTLNREEAIKRFSTNHTIHAFLISLKAGGVGLNLTEADYVFIIDPWWNPAAETQAISRSHRIGQNKQVFAYRFITQNSIEEKIIRLQESKRKLSETFIGDNNPWQTLTDKEWADLLEN